MENDFKTKDLIEAGESVKINQETQQSIKRLLAFDLYHDSNSCVEESVKHEFERKREDILEMLNQAK